METTTNSIAVVQQINSEASELEQRMNQMIDEFLAKHQHTTIVVKNNISGKHLVLVVMTNAMGILRD